METLNFKKTCRRILSNAAVLLSAAGLCIAVPQGCTDLGTETSSRSHEGISGNAGEKVRVIFKPYIEYPETKAADNSVRNIIVAVYGGGTLVESLDLDSGAEASVELESGKDYSYYAAANIASVEFPLSEEDALGMRATVSPEEPSGGFPMAASGSFTVSGDENTVTVMLQRLYSKIRFKVDLGEVPDLEITSVRIMQAANSVALFSESKAVLTTGGDEASYEELSAVNSGSEIELYLPENCQGVLLPDNTDSSGKIPDNIPGKSGVCSYMEVEGEFSGEMEFIGNVTYRFYLGNDETSDFNVVRNTDNTVTMTLLRESISSPTWQVDAGDVYADVPFLLSSSYMRYYHVDKRVSAMKVLMPFSSYYWRDIIRGDNCYIGIAGDSSEDTGVIVRSEDGLNWKTVHNAGSDLSNIAYGNGTFVVTTGTKTILVSAGGQIWTEKEMSSEANSVFFGNGIFLVTGTYGVWRSGDGLNWTAVKTGLTYPTEGAYGNGEYVITSNYLYTAKSTDGITWTRYTNSFDVTAYPASGMTYGNGVFLMTTGGRELLRSTDGYNWESVQSLSGYGTTSVDFKDGVFAAVARKTIDGRSHYCVMTSLDGEKWTEIFSHLNMSTLVCIL